MNPFGFGFTWVGALFQARLGCQGGACGPAKGLWTGQTRISRACALPGHEKNNEREQEDLLRKTAEQPRRSSITKDDDICSEYDAVLQL